ncbi:MAG: hypothetical protein ACLSE8_09340 [Parasutterella sp.]
MSRPSVARCQIRKEFYYRYTWQEKQRIAEDQADEICPSLLIAKRTFELAEAGHKGINPKEKKLQRAG